MNDDNIPEFTVTPEREAAIEDMAQLNSQMGQVYDQLVQLKTGEDITLKLNAEEARLVLLSMLGGQKRLGDALVTALTVGQDEYLPALELPLDVLRKVHEIADACARGEGYSSSEPVTDGLTIKSIRIGDTAIKASLSGVPFAEYEKRVEQITLEEDNELTDEQRAAMIVPTDQSVN